MLAAGYFEPKAPFFFLQEYKKEKGTADDVIGQLLSAMLVAQNINNNNKPLYGCRLNASKRRKKRSCNFVGWNYEKYLLKYLIFGF
jgi:glutathione peroxidase-family protein